MPLVLKTSRGTVSHDCIYMRLTLKTINDERMRRGTMATLEKAGRYLYFQLGEGRSPQCGLGRVCRFLRAAYALRKRIDTDSKNLDS